MKPDQPEERMFNNKLTEAISSLAHEICALRGERKNEFDWLKSHAGLATKQDLKELVNKIMSVLSDWAAKVSPKLERLQKGIDNLQALVEKLQNTPGAITPEDQALLDKIDKQVDDLGVDADSVPATPPAEPPPV